MPQNITDSTGAEIEVYTAEEIAAKEEEASAKAIADYKAANPDQTEKLTELEKQLTTAKDDLAKADDKDQNFAALRGAKEKAEKDLTEFQANFSKALDERLSAFKGDVLGAVQQDHFNETLKAFTGGDDELMKQVKFQYDRIKDVAGTKEEITKKLSDAYLLATATPERNALNTTVLSSGGTSIQMRGGAKAPLGADEKELGAKFGLSDQDLKKFGN